MQARLGPRRNKDNPDDLIDSNRFTVYIYMYIYLVTSKVMVTCSYLELLITFVSNYHTYLYLVLYNYILARRSCMSTVQLLITSL